MFYFVLTVYKPGSLLQQIHAMYTQAYRVKTSMTRTSTDCLPRLIRARFCPSGALPIVKKKKKKKKKKKEQIFRAILGEFSHFFPENACCTQ